MENDAITIRMPTSFDEACSILDFVSRKSETLYDATHERTARTRFPILVPDATKDRDRALYESAPEHRRIAFEDPEACALRPIPTAIRTSFRDATCEDLDRAIARRYSGERSGKARSGGTDKVIAVINLQHLAGSADALAAIDHLLGIGVTFVVALVDDPAALAAIRIPTEVHERVVLYK